MKVLRHRIFLHSLALQPVPIPLSITVTAIRNNRRVGRNRVDSPMDKDSKFGFVKPGRNSAGV